MAPTLNSTLIHSAGDSSEKDSSATTATEKELSQYSPILARPRRAPPSPFPVRNAIKSAFAALGSSTNEASSSSIQEEINEIPIWICGEPRFVSGITSQTTCNNIIEALIEDELQNIGSSDCDAMSRDLRDYAITEKWRDIELPLPGETFILTLWKAWGTKCATNEVKFKLRVNKWAASSQQLEVAAKKRPTPATTASHERQGTSISSSSGSKDTQERPHNKMKHGQKSERITMINRMMKKILKQGETIKQHLSQLTEGQAEVQRIDKLCQKIRQTKQGKRILMEHFIQSTSLRTKEDDALLLSSAAALTSDDELFYLDPILTDLEEEEKAKEAKDDRNKKDVEEEEEDDELFLVIENNDDLDSGVHFESNKRPTSQLTEMQQICSSVEMTEVLLETPKRKKRFQRNFEDLKRHTLTTQFTSEAMSSADHNQREKTPTVFLENPDFRRTSLQFDTIRREIIVKMNDLKGLLQKEEDLIVNLEGKCEKYKRENEVYGKKLGVQLNVDEIQTNLNDYAKDIAQHLSSLYQTKLEIRENYLVLDDLKEMLVDKDPISGFGTAEFNRLVENKFGLTTNPATTTADHGNPPPKQGHRLANPSFITSPFVDQVHEFCDNNDSIIV